ncbi:protein C11orf74 homolog isoform X2 [Sarcophilus harrisii]|uniref:protein C11orf74 homolog isoform X2 n=1 Tax=Sarcophilus harrisii TaxID=9305 RepID=UPI001301B766|nr:protein C11orf74 homolog isoform X2 [Sarcophilus harrisii]
MVQEDTQQSIWYEEAAQIGVSVQLLRVGIMDDDQLIAETLDHFINHRESKKELSADTCLSKDDQDTKERTPGPDASENRVASDLNSQPPCLENEQPHMPSLAKTSEEEQIMIDKGRRVGNSTEGDLDRAGKVKVDNFLDLEDFDMDEEIDPKSIPELLLLPGEVEEEYHYSTSSYIPSFDQYSQSESKSLPPTEHLVFGHFKEVSGDEVQPFSLDEDFDYDNVILTPKYSNAEMKTFEEMSNQSKPSPDPQAKESNK